MVFTYNRDKSQTLLLKIRNFWANPMQIVKENLIKIIFSLTDSPKSSEQHRSSTHPFRSQIKILYILRGIFLIFFFSVYDFFLFHSSLLIIKKSSRRDLIVVCFIFMSGIKFRARLMNFVCIFSLWDLFCGIFFQ